MRCREKALLGPDEDWVTVLLTRAELDQLEAEALAAGLSVEAYASALIKERHRQLADAALDPPADPASH